MSVDFELNAESRTDVGKGASRRLRRANRVPGVIYGGGTDPQSITLDGFQLGNALEHEAFYSHVLTLKVDGKAQTAVLKDLQRHPYKPTIVHADFLRVSAKDTIRMHVPIHYINEDKAYGVKQEGGQIFHNLSDIEIACEARNLPEYIEVDLTDVHLGQTIHLSDLKLPKGVEIPALAHGEEHNLPVVSIRGAAKASADDEAEDEAGEGSAEE